MMERTTEILAAAAVASFMAISCTESYPGLDYVPDPSHVIKNTENLALTNTPIQVFATEQDFFAVGTRGTGTFEDFRLNKPKYLNSTFHVFAFRAGTGSDGSGGQGDLNSAPDLTRTAYSPTKEQANDPSFSSCLLDGSSYYTGAPYSFNADLSGAFEPKDGMRYYYSADYPAVGYNFFAYHIDDFVPTAANTHRNADRIWYDIEVDGARDIMFGSAPAITGVLLDTAYSELNLTDKEKANIMKGCGGYSTYSGYRHVDPIVDLSHKLCRLRFWGYPGDTSSDSTTIDSISVVSKYRGEMTVAGRTPNAISLTWDDTAKRELFLSETSADSIQPYPGRLREGGYTLEWDPTLSKDNQRKTQIGSSLMIPPTESFALRIYSTYTDIEGKKINYPVEYIISNPPSAVRKDGQVTHIFDEGILYNIYIRVYGPKRIIISVETTGWVQGEDVNVDMDDFM